MTNQQTTSSPEEPSRLFLHDVTSEPIPSELQGSYGEDYSFLYSSEIRGYLLRVYPESSELVTELEAWESSLPRAFKALKDVFNIDNVRQEELLNAQAIDWTMARIEAILSGTHEWSKYLLRTNMPEQSRGALPPYVIGISLGMDLVRHNPSQKIYVHPNVSMVVVAHQAQTDEMAVVEQAVWVRADAQ